MFEGWLRISGRKYAWLPPRGKSLCDDLDGLKRKSTRLGMAGMLGEVAVSGKGKDRSRQGWNRLWLWVSSYTYR